MTAAADDPIQRFSPGEALSRGAFLACSWTWCIGMWLPVYLISDFGGWGWLAFAVPNVIGAMAVGFVHRTPAAATAFRARSMATLRWFSVVTIAFHLGFLGWTCWEQCPPYVPRAAAFGVPLLAVVVGLALSAFGSRAWGALAVLVLPVAPAVMVAAMWTTNFWALDIPPAAGTVTDPVALPLYATGLAFGFLLCPHLDLSILRVREEAPGATGDTAFVLGFGVMFLMLIALTAFYAAGFLGGWFSYYLLVHFFVQGTFTVGAHLRELREHGWPRLLRPGWPVGAVLIAAAMVALAPVSELAVTVLNKPPTRVAYESVLWFYALPLPAAGLFMLLRKPLRRAFWVSTGAATPLMAAGALWGVWWAIPAAVGVPVAAAVLARRQGS